MANFKGVYQHVASIDFEAGEDLTGDVHRLVRIDADGRVIKTALPGEIAIGVVGMDPNRNQGSTETSENQIIQVVSLMGILLIEAGAAINIGDFVHSDAVGRIVTAGANVGALAADDYVIGQTVEAASAAGAIISVHCMPFLHTA